MIWQNNPYSIPFAIAALLILPVAYAAWKRRTIPGALGLMGVALSSAYWATCSALQWASADIFAQIFWFKAHYIGTHLLTFSTLVFIVHYTTQSHPFRQPKNYLPLLIVIAIFQIIIWTNEGHGLFIRSVRESFDQPFTAPIFTYGSIFWLHAFYSYAILIIAFGVGIFTLTKSPRIHRLQISAIVIGGLIPATTSALYNLKIFPIQSLDLTPFGTIITSILMLYSISRYGMLEIIPTTRDTVLENLSDPIFILDDRYRIIDLNSAARRAILNPLTSPVGNRLADVFPAWAQITATTPDLDSLREIEIVLGNLDNRPDYELRISPVIDSEGKTTGRIAILRDITARKRAEATLKQTQSRFNSIIEDIEDPYFESNLLGKILFANTSLYATLQYADGELNGRDFRDTVEPNDASKILNTYANVYETGEAVKSMEYRFIRKDGNTGIGELSLSLIRDQSGQGTGFRGIIRDITERKEAEQALRNSQALFEEVIENIEDPYYECDLQGTLTFVNPAFCNSIDYTFEEIKDRSFRHLTTRGEFRRIFQTFNRVYETEQPVRHEEYTFNKKDGSLVFTELSVSLRRDANNKPVGFRGVIHDITERKYAEEALKQSEEKYRTILEDIRDGYYELDLFGNLITANEVTCEIIGVTLDSIMGVNFGQFTDSESAARLFKVYNDVFKTGVAAKNIIYDVTLNNGTRKTLEASASLIRNSEGKAKGFRGVVRDITQRRRAEVELRKAKEAAETASQAKSSFLNTVSHELRTPLTSVLGFAKLIRKRMSETILPAIKIEDRKVLRAVEQVNSNVDIIIAEGERLTTLINDVLDLAKIESGKVEWKEDKLEIAEVIERASAATASLFEQKSLRLVLDIEEHLPIILGDRDRLIQVVINLISNAVKFTEKGSVTCTAKRRDGNIVVSVIDTGIGIALENHNQVFEQFVQVGNTLTDKPKGTGLGLPICKEIVEHHGGTIWVESEVGKGSTFIFTVPSVSPKAEVGETTIPSIEMGILIAQLKEQILHVAITGDPNRRKKVLIVDDEDNVRELLRQELEADGYDVCEARDGREALAQVKNEHPNLILLDVMMPELNGFDVAAVLRNDPQTLNIPIIILSVMHDQERGYRIGADRYFTKPVEAHLLMTEVNRLLTRGVSKNKVLIIEDSPELTQTLRTSLEGEGYDVETVHRTEAISKATKSQPDIILINSNQDGQSQLLKSLRSEKGLESVSFLLFH